MVFLFVLCIKLYSKKTFLVFSDYKLTVSIENLANDEKYKEVKKISQDDNTWR